MIERALVVTDLVDSTGLAATLGDERAGGVSAAHDRVARDLMAEHGGREIDKSDGFLLLFLEPERAIAYARAYHAAIAPLDLQARAGVYFGPVSLRENPSADVARGAKPLEVDGLGKAIAARLMAVAGGGQTLATRAAVGNVKAVSHGHWMLKGLLEPLEVFEIGDHLPPPVDGAKAWRVHRLHDVWIPVREVRHHLPAERDAFVGREADLLEVAGLLDGGARLVTLLGIGGTGKTRLALRLGWTWLGEWPGGVWFCDFSEARDVPGIAAAAAATLKVTLGKGDPIALLGQAIARRGRCLVILDNLEQVTRPAAQVIGTWLDNAAEAHFVATSREVLGLQGETTLALSPLGEDDAVALFTTRAVQARREFVLAESDKASVRELVRLLDRLPLAIELAAARVRLLPPRALLERMSERFKLLAAPGGRPSRQSTLRGALDWSWDLLSPDERAALGQLTVFQGGFSLEAAEAVLELGELWAVDAVQALVDKSLVRSLADARFDLLTTVQEYAAEKLDLGGGRPAAEKRHGAFFARLGTNEALDALHRHGGGERRRALVKERDNLVAACHRALARGDGAVAAAALAAAWKTIESRGPIQIGRELARSVLAMEHLTPQERAATEMVAAWAAWKLGQVEEARAGYVAALGIARSTGDCRMEGLALGYLGVLHAEQGRMDDARAHYEASLPLHREAGNRHFEGIVHAWLGIVDAEQGRNVEARAHLEAALALYREIGDVAREAMALHDLGMLNAEEGRLDDALACYQAAMASEVETGNRHLAGVVGGEVGNLLALQGQLDAARSALEVALGILREVGERRYRGVVQGDLGRVLAAQGHLDEARQQYRAALEIHREVGNHRYEAIVRARLALTVPSGEALEHLAAGEALLRAMSDPGSLATLLTARAEVCARDGDAPAAAAALTEAAAVVPPQNVLLRAEIARVRSLLAVAPSPAGVP